MKKRGQLARESNLPREEILTEIYAICKNVQNFQLNYKIWAQYVTRDYAECSFALSLKYVPNIGRISKGIELDPPSFPHSTLSNAFRGVGISYPGRDIQEIQGTEIQGGVVRTFPGNVTPKERGGRVGIHIYIYFGLNQFQKTFLHGICLGKIVLIHCSQMP